MPSENLKLKDISNKFTQESKINNDPAMDEFVKLETQHKTSLEKEIYSAVQ